MRAPLRHPMDEKAFSLVGMAAAATAAAVAACYAAAVTAVTTFRFLLDVEG